MDSVSSLEQHFNKDFGQGRRTSLTAFKAIIAIPPEPDCCMSYLAQIVHYKVVNADVLNELYKWKLGWSCIGDVFYTIRNRAFEFDGNTRLTDYKDLQTIKHLERIANLIQAR